MSQNEPVIGGTPPDQHNLKGRWNPLFHAVANNPGEWVSMPNLAKKEAETCRVNMRSRLVRAQIQVEVRRVDNGDDTYTVWFLNTTEPQL